ncbi:hypothetical protein BC826DRAFT_1109484 [Russula brevipes]|nr:hypothetical protein BC826DRAFT_1109484 [Russula brevipes]
MGSSAIGYSTTFADLRNSDCTTCKVKDDKSAYWIPELYYQYKNGSFQAVSHGGMLVYYLQRGAANETVQAFPDGLRLLAGNPFLRSYAGTPEAKAISWKCIDFNGPPEQQTPGFANNTHCPSGLRAQVFFPSCWDGKNLDSPDHKSHMAYPDGVDSGQCPPSRRALRSRERRPDGYGLHADFMNGWDRNVLERAVVKCTADSGVVEDCPVFKDEGRFYTDDENNACSATNPLPGEKVGPGTLLPTLPGCVAVTEGPAPATPADLVPGCVPGGGNGNGSPNPLPNTTSISAPTSTSLSSEHVPTASPPSKATSPALSGQTSHSSTSIPVTSPPSTTSLRPMTHLTSPSTPSVYGDGSHTSVPPPRSSEVKHSPHGAAPAPVPSSAHTKEATSTPKTNITVKHLPTTVATESPVPPLPLSHHKHKQHHKPVYHQDNHHYHHHGHGDGNGHGHGHHPPGHEMKYEQGDNMEYCDEEVPPSYRPGRKTRSVLAHRRHHAKRGHGSRMLL